MTTSKQTLTCIDCGSQEYVRVYEIPEDTSGLAVRYDALCPECSGVFGIEAWHLNLMTTDEQYQELAKVIARRLGFQTEPVKRFLLTLSGEPFAAYSQVVEKDDGKPMGAAWSFVWRGITETKA